MAKTVVWKAWTGMGKRWGGGKCVRIARANEKQERGTWLRAKEEKKHKGGTCVSMGCANTKQAEVKQ